MGPYELRIPADLGLSDDARSQGSPPMYSLSWVASRGLVFAMQVGAGVAGADPRKRVLEIAGMSHSQTAQEYAGVPADRYVQELAPGFECVVLRLSDPLGEHGERPMIVEQYVGHAYGDILDFTLVMKDAHVEHADALRRLFCGMVFDAIIRRGESG